MTSIQFTLYALVALAILLFIVSFSKQFKFLFNFVLRASIGIFTFSLLNILFASSNFFIASNIFTVTLSGFLGFYGILALILSNIIL